MQVVLGSDGTSSVPTAVVATMARPGPGEFVQDTDEQIAARFTAGDAAAFGELMQRHMGAVFGVAYGVLHDRDDAADVTQDVFLRLSRSLPNMHVQGSLGPWLYRVAMNCAIDRLRQNRRHATVNVDDERTLDRALPDPGVALERIELRRHVFRAVSRLPEKQRIVFTMRHVSGLSLEEIAVATNCATGTVKCHLARATRRLRELLEPYLDEARREV